MAVVQVNGSAVTSTSTNNNGGTAINVGSSSSVLENFTLGDKTSLVTGFPGSSGVPYDNNSPISKRLTTELAGSANDFLLSGSADSSDTYIHRSEGRTSRLLTTAIRNGYWNQFTGEFSPAVSGSVDDFGQDHASRPTLDIPGELTYKTSAPNPVNDDYNARYL